LPGVRATRVGWLAGHEVVDVRFDPARLALAELVRQASAAGCTERVWVAEDAALASARELVGERAQILPGEPRAAEASDEQYYLGRSPLRFLPLTPLQAQRLNSALGSAGTPEEVLSPRQTQLALRIDRLFQADPRAFEGLERPESSAGLRAYEEQLEGRLSRVDAAPR
jgi:hypothetical protein